MTIVYCDLLNGNDSNNGSSFALRKKTLASASTGLTPGDTIRVMSSGEPVSLGNCAWSNSTNITIPSALTAVINNANNGATGWTVSTNVTGSVNTGLTFSKLTGGTGCTQLSISASFTTGIIAYAACSTTNLSAYNAITLWYANSSGSIPANTYYIDLCSDSVGAVPVASFPIPAQGPSSNNGIIPFTLTLGSSLPSNVNSIAVRRTSNTGAVVVYLNNIMACQSTGLSLNSVIGLNTSGEPEWYPIRAISGTTIYLDIFANWVGSTGSLNTFYMVPIRQDQLLSALPNGWSGTAITGWTLTSGSALGTINVSFGWNTTDMSTQITGTSCTAIDWQSFSGPNGPIGDYLYVDRLISIRSYTPLQGSTNQHFMKFGLLHCVMPYFSYLAGQNATSITTLIFDTICITAGYQVSSSIGNGNVFGNTFNLKYSSGNALTQTFYYLYINYKCSIKNFTSHASYRSFNFVNSGEVVIGNFNVIPGNLSGVSTGTLLYTQSSDVKISNVSVTPSSYGYGIGIQYYNGKCSIANWTGAPLLGTFNSSSTTPGQSNYFIQNYNSTGIGKGMTDCISYTSDSVNVHTAGGIAWAILAANTNSYAFYSDVSDSFKTQNIKIGEVPVKSGSLCTLSIWTKRDYTTTTGTLFIKPNIPGVTDYVYSQSSASAGTWEQLSISFTPSINTVVDVYFGVSYDVTHTGNVYIDDFTASQ